MLNQYISNTQSLLQNPGAPTTLYSTANITTWINIARGQIAGEGMCVRRIGTITTTIGTRSYNFSSISFLDTSVAGALDVNWLMYGVGSGQKWVKNKSWPWFSLYRYNNPVPSSGAPTEWAQYGQGSAGSSITAGGSGSVSSGNLYLDPLPDLAYTLYVDCFCYPIALASDSDAEAIPYLWTDAVPYFAAYLALMSSQTTMRLEQAQRLFQLYEMFMQRARNAANPSIGKYNYAQSGDPAMANRYAASGGQ